MRSLTVEEPLQEAAVFARTRERTHFFDSDEHALDNEEQPSQPNNCGARTRSGAPCDRHPEPGRRRCRLHGGASGVGAPRGNRNARRHGRYSGQNREIRALGRILNCVADLARAQLALSAHAAGDAHRVAIAEQRVLRCAQRVLRAARALDRVAAARGDHEGRRLVEGALRLASAASSVASTSPSFDGS